MGDEVRGARVGRRHDRGCDHGRVRTARSATSLSIRAALVAGVVVSSGFWSGCLSAGASGVARPIHSVSTGDLLHAPSRSDLPLNGPPPVAGGGTDLLRLPHQGRHLEPRSTRRGAVAHTTLLASSNWSGIIDTGTTYSAVAGDWTVPWPFTSTGERVASTWIGISGVKDNALIQVGVTEAVTGHAVTYAAWYELIPAAPIQIDRPVAHGDQMRALILQKGPRTWYVGIEDLTQGWVVTGIVPYTASLANSAEWITERPTTGSTGKLLTLPDYGTARFHDLRLNGVDLTTSQITYAFMTNTATQIISYPSVLVPTTTGTFTDTYGTPLPSITSVAPASGEGVGGTAVTLTGTFVVPTLVRSVDFGTHPAQFSVSATGGITATAPRGAAGTVHVTVTTTDGTSPATSSDLFTYEAPPPVITSVSPARGPTSGATVVSIAGAHFTGVSMIRFGTTAATNIRVISPTLVVATNPAHVPGQVAVTVTTTYGSNANSAGAAFRYTAPDVTSVSPREGPRRGGTNVRIAGSSFVRGASVWFGKKRAVKVVVMSSTRIVAESPRGTGTVNVFVTIPDGRSTSSPANAFTYR